MREIIKNFVASHWSDEQIAYAFAFNQDGKMDALNPCKCFVGLHNLVTHGASSNSAYCYAKQVEVPEISSAESAYMHLGLVDGFPFNEQGVSLVQSARDVIFGNILAEIMAERAQTSTQPTPELAEVSA